MAVGRLAAAILGISGLGVAGTSAGLGQARCGSMSRDAMGLAQWHAALHQRPLGQDSPAVFSAALGAFPAAAGGSLGSASGASLLVHALAESLAALPQLSDERDRQQVEGITRLARVLQVRCPRPHTAAAALLPWVWPCCPGGRGSARPGLVTTLLSVGMPRGHQGASSPAVPLTSTV